MLRQDIIVHEVGPRDGLQVEKAVAAVIKAGRVRTYDMGGTSTTLEMGEAVAKAL